MAFANQMSRFSADASTVVVVVGRGVVNSSDDTETLVVMLVL